MKKFNILRLFKKIKKKIINIKAIKLILINNKIIYINKKNISLNIKFKKKKNLKKKITYLNFFKNIHNNLPFYFININNNNKKKYIKYQWIIKIKENIIINIIEQNINYKNELNFNNINKRFFLNKKSTLNYINLINLNKKSYFKNKNIFLLKEKSHLKQNLFLINAKKIEIKNNLFLKKKSISNIKSISLINKNKFKFYIKVLHLSYKSKSYQYHKSINFNKGFFKFKGLIKILKKANNTFSTMENSNLCINQNTSIITYPILQIYNNNSKCKHKAIICNLNKDEIFYLLSRGIGIKKIKKILSLNFINKIINKLKIKKVNIFIKNLINLIIFKN